MKSDPGIFDGWWQLIRAWWPAIVAAVAAWAVFGFLLLLGARACAAQRANTPKVVAVGGFTVGALILDRTVDGPRVLLTSAERVVMLTTTALIMVDWGQTIHFRQNGVAEINPLLGPHPSRGRINLLIGAGLGAHLAISRLRRPEHRLMIWLPLLLAEVSAVAHNVRVTRGLHLAFPF